MGLQKERKGCIRKCRFLRAAHISFDLQNIAHRRVDEVCYGFFLRRHGRRQIERFDADPLAKTPYRPCMKLMQMRQHQRIYLVYALLREKFRRRQNC